MTEASVEKKRLDRIKLNILKAEKENISDRACNAEQMVDRLRKIIEEEVNKCF